MHIDSVKYSLPTIAVESFAFSDHSATIFEGALQFHEDQWGQLEFFSRTRLPEIQGMLKELKSFEAAHRGQSGWNDIYLRSTPRLPIGELPPDFSHQAAAKFRPAPILTTSTHPLGQLQNGFSIDLAEHAYLYGLEEAGQVTVLGALLQGADDMILVNTFSDLNKKYGLILVDWLQQFALVSVSADGQLEVWRP